MATYKANYQSFLEARMSAGGTPAEMASCVEEYNNIEQETRFATVGFVAWACGETHTCSACRKRFDALDAPPLVDETVCPACTLEAAGA